MQIIIQVKQVSKNGPCIIGIGNVVPEYFGGTSQAWEFINSLTDKWKRVPKDLLGRSTTENFTTYARRCDT